MRIIFIGEYDFCYTRPKTGNCWERDMMFYLARYCDSIIDYTRTWEPKRNDMLKFKPDIVVLIDVDILRTHFDTAIEFWQGHGVPVIHLAIDLFHLALVKVSPNLYKVDGIVSSVEMLHMQRQYEQLLPNTCVSGLDLFINDDKFYSHPEIEKEYDIVIYGTLNGELKVDLELDAHKKYFERWVQRGEPIPLVHLFYPLRKRLYDVITQSGKYRVNHVPQPRGGCWNCPVRGEQLSKTIATAYLGVATTSRADKCMQKYIEIAASDTFLLGNIPTSQRDVFEGHIIEVGEEMTDAEILAKIDKALEDKKGLERRAKEFGKMIRQKYGWKNTHTARKFYEFCEKVKMNAQKSS